MEDRNDCFAELKGMADNLRDKILSSAFLSKNSVYKQFFTDVLAYTGGGSVDQIDGLTNVARYYWNKAASILQDDINGWGWVAIEFI